MVVVAEFRPTIFLKLSVPLTFRSCAWRFVAPKVVAKNEEQLMLLQLIKLAFIVVTLLMLPPLINATPSLRVVAVKLFVIKESQVSVSHVMAPLDISVIPSVNSIIPFIERV
jgi:hypothetical protein